MKIIFLDIDGVLNSEKWYTERFDKDLQSYPLCEFDPLCVEQLNILIQKTNAKLVISSTWRLGRTIDELKNLFEKVGITFVWGLHEKDKPPTLISPRPKIRKKITIGKEKRTVIRNERWDDLMNECLNTFPHKIIIEQAISKKAIFDLNKKEIIYDYNS